MKRLKIAYRRILLLLPLLFIGIYSWAQLPQCGADVPFYRVDLSGQPNGTWVSPNHIRNGNCCGTTSPDRCTSYEIILDSRTAAINFRIASGAIPPGSMFYQVNCGAPVAVGQPICLSGAGPHRLTFCKPGNNTNTYAIDAIPEPIFPDDITTRKGCSTKIKVLGLDANTVSFTSVFPGTTGQYNSLLSCTSNCTEPSFTAPAAATLPAFIDYKICGFPTADECGFILTVCDTVRVYIKDLLGGTISPNPASYCAGGGGVLLTAQGTGGDGNYQYTWRNSSSAIVGTGATFNATTQDNYTVQIKDGLSTTTCPDVFVSVPVVVGTPPVVNAGQDVTVCATSPQVILSGSVQYATGGIWTGGNGNFYPSNTALNAAYTPTTQEINNGSVTLTLTSAGAGGGCSNSSDQVMISFSDTMNIVMPNTQLTCHGSSIVLAPVITGGIPPYRYEWNNGANTSSIVAGEGNYCVTVYDKIGCKTTKCVNVTSPPPMSVSISSTDVTVNGGNNGTASVTVAGGTPTYTYLWNNGATTSSISNLIYGVYTVTVKDKNGCTITASVVVNEPRCLSLTAAGTSTNVTCFGQHNGTAQVSVTGGTKPYTYLWTNGATQNNVANLNAGSITVTVTDSNGCKEVVSLVITEPTMLTNTINHTDIPIIGGNTGTATANPFGGSGTYIYNWSNGSNTQTITNLTAGVYVLTLSDANNCILIDSVKINEPPCEAISISVAKADITCFGQNNGTATALISNGIPPYTISWSNGMSGAAISGLSAGNYTVTVVDSVACTDFHSFSVEEPSELSIALSPTHISCNGLSNGTIELTVTGGTFPYTFLWSTGSTGEVLSGLKGGTYSVTVTDASGCSKSASVTINEPAAIVTTYTKTDNLCFNGNKGAIDVTVSGGVNPLSYMWSNGATSQDLTNLSSGFYTLTIKDANNCVKESAVQVGIVEPSQLSATIVAKQNIFCKGASTGIAVAAGQGGTGTYSYTWNTNPIQANDTATALSAGTYVVTVYDNNGCTIPATASVTITEPANALLSSITSKTNVFCKGDSTGSATVAATGGSGAYSYVWNTVPAQFTATATVLKAGTYTVQVFDQNGCNVPSVSTVTITEPAQKLVVNIVSQQNVLCKGLATGTATSVATGGSGSYSYSWNTSTVQTGAIATNLAAGQYIVTVYDNNGCTKPAKDTVTITEPSQVLAASITSQTNVDCKGNFTGTATVTASGGSGSYSYSWNSTPIQTTAVLSNVPAGSYTVTVRDNNGCTVPKTATTTITEPALALGITISSPKTNGFNITCYGSTNGSIALTVTGGTAAYTYEWTGPNGYVASTEDLSGLAAGTYNIKVTDSKGCIKTGNIILTQPAQLQISSVMNPTLCSGSNTGSISLTVTGGISPYSYSWTGPGGFTSSTKNITALGAGTYTVVVTDANSCTKTTTVQVTQPGTLTMTSVVGSYNGGYNIRCNGGTDGNISITVSGGTPGYTYSWTGTGGYTSSAEDISSLAAGQYEVLITDNNGCTINTVYNLTQPAALTATLTPDVYNGGFNVSCKGENDGSIDLTVSGGTPLYQYSWSNSQTTEDINNLVAGNYSVLITDANNCPLSKSITLTEPAVLSSTISAHQYVGGFNITCFGAADGAVDLGVTGGASPYTYSWNNGLTSQDLAGIPVGTYNVTITDNNGCTTANTITLTQPDSLKLTYTTSVYNGGYNISCNNLSNGAINITVTGGTNSYVYQWTNGYQTQDLNNVAAGNYQVNVTDGNGCMVYRKITLTQPDELTASYTTSQYTGNNQVSCHGKTDGSIDLTLTGGTLSYSVVWTYNGAAFSTNQDLTNLAAGLYAVQVTDANGCKVNLSTELKSPSPLVVTATTQFYNGGYNIRCFGNSDGIAQAYVSGGTLGYVYSWTGPGTYTASSQNINNISAGTYTITVTDTNNCAAENSVLLTQPTQLTISLTSPQYAGNVNISCNGNTNGSINHVTAGGTAPYNYVWTGPGSYYATTTYISGLAAGEYHTILTDDNGCTITDSIMLVEPDPLLLSITHSNYNGYGISCHDGSDGAIDLSVTGGTTAYTYLWRKLTTATYYYDQDLNNITGGQYNVLVTDANGCKDSTSVIITQPAKLLVTSVVSDYNGYGVSCNKSNNGFIDLTVQGGVPSYTYQWEGASTATVQDITALTAGQYNVLVTDTNNCSMEMSIILTEPTPLLLSAAKSDYNGYGVSCYEGSNGFIDLNVTGGVPDNPDLYTYNWSNSQQTEDLFNVTAQDYTVTVTDKNGCTGTLSVLITQPEKLTISIYANFYSGGVNVSCNNANDGSIGSMVFGGVQGYSYMWSNGDTTNFIQNLAAGSYGLTVTDTNGCEVYDRILLVEPDKLVGLLTPTVYAGGYNITCYGAADGAINATISGGVTNYTYAWTGGANTEDITNVQAGAYKLVVTDQNGCIYTDSLYLTQPDSLALSTSTQTATCAGANGGIDLTVQGGTPDYVYAWNNGAVSQDINDAAAGTYTVLVTDANGCTKTTTAIVELISSMMLNSVVNDVLCYGDANGSVKVYVSEGTAPYEYRWSNGATTDSLTNLVAGTYTVVVTDANNCESTQTYTISQNDSITVTLTSPEPIAGFQISAYQGTDGSINLEADGGAKPYSYNWSDGHTTEDLEQLPAGIYTVLVTDENGCTEKASILLKAPLKLEIPSGYTPNNDGQNDYFVVRGIEAFPHNKIMIFNRWGNEVYSESGYNNKWAGLNNKGDELPEGTYFVIFTVDNTDIELRGYVDLRR